MMKLTDRILKVIDNNPLSKPIFKTLVVYLESLDNGQVDLPFEKSVREFTTQELHTELKRRKGLTIIYPETFNKFIEGFNYLKKKYTGIDSRYTTKNKDSIERWNSFVSDMDESKVQEIIGIKVSLAMYAISEDSFHKSNHYRFLNPEFLLRVSKLEKWYNVGEGQLHSSNSHKFDFDRENNIKRV